MSVVVHTQKYLCDIFAAILCVQLTELLRGTTFHKFQQYNQHTHYGNHNKG